MTFTLAQLEEAIRGAWSEDTASEDNDWTPCSAATWNRLPSGREVDLTREQFRSGQVIGEARVGNRPATFDPSHPRHRYEKYLVLSERVRASLGLRS